MINKEEIFEGLYESILEGLEWAFEEKAAEYRSYVEGATILTEKLIKKCEETNNCNEQTPEVSVMKTDVKYNLGNFLDNQNTIDK